MRSEWSHIAQKETVSGPSLSAQQDRIVGIGLVVGGFLLPVFAVASYLNYQEPPHDYVREAIEKQVNEAVTAQLPSITSQDKREIPGQFTISGRIDDKRLVADIGAANRQTIGERVNRRQTAGLTGFAGAAMSLAGGFLLFRRRDNNGPTNG